VKHVAYFGDGEKTFALTDPMIRELENKTGVGIGLLSTRCMSSYFYIGDLIEIIRLGLIGADMSPAEAQRLVDSYATNRPFAEIVPLALDILAARWGREDEAPRAIPLTFLRRLPPMTERLNVNAAEHTGAAWAPAAETILQLDSADPTAKVLVQARVSTAAPWTNVGALSQMPSDLDRFVRLPRFPELRLVVSRNSAGSLVQVWDNE